MTKTKAQKRMAKMVRDNRVRISGNTVSFNVETPEELEATALAMGMKYKPAKSRKMTDGPDIYNIVAWGQNSNWDEWYVTDTMIGNKTIVIIDTASSCTITPIDLSLSNPLKPSSLHGDLPASVPEHGPWKWC